MVDAVAAQLNASLSDPLGVTIAVRRFEHLTPRAGRPQTRINDWSSEYDLFIGVVHRRWGSPSGNGDETGFSEEFRIASERFASAGSPEIALYFKHVDEASVADPGPQLSRVLEFRRSIEANQILLYKGFSSTEEFRTLVYQLLVEHMHMHAQRGAGALVHTPGRTAAEVRAEVSTESTTTEDTNGRPLETILRNIANVVSGEKSEAPLNLDRFLLFATSTSIDNELIPTHLANRIAANQRVDDLRPVETSAWIRAFLSSVGQTKNPEDRNFPLGQLASEKDILKLLATHAGDLIASDQGWVRSGAARTCLALGERPVRLWSRKKADRSKVVEAWSTLFSNDVVLATDLWLVQARPSDHYLLREFATADSITTAQAAEDIQQLLADGTADGLVGRNSLHLLSKSLSTVLGCAAAKKTSTEILSKIAMQPYVDAPVRAVAITELALRNDLPLEYLRFIIDRSEAAKPTQQIELLDLEIEVVRALSSESLVDAMRAVTENRKPDVLFFPGFNPIMRRRLEQSAVNDAISFLLFHAVTQEASLFAIAGERTGMEDAARAWLSKDAGTIEKFEKEKRESGQSEGVIEVKREAIQFAAAVYLFGLSDQNRSPEDVDTLRKLGKAAKRNRSEWNALLDWADPDPASRMKVHASPFDGTKRLPYLARKVPTRELKSLLDAKSDPDLTNAALTELVSRRAHLSKRQARPLLRSANARTRLLTARITYIRDSKDKLLQERIAYINDESAYYYNVVAEIDRLIANLPEL